MSIFHNFAEKITRWYQGDYVPPPPRSNNDSFVMLSVGHYEQPILARILGAIGRFIRLEWKWLIGSCIAIIALYLKQ